jgi:predicted deacylase
MMVFEFFNYVGTLRSEAMSLGIKAITVEIGNPQLFQSRYVLWSYSGVMRILSYLSMFTPESELSKPPNMILCSKGFWIYTTTGGVLEVYPNVNTFIKRGDLIAR